jgi:hypothetical protein
MDAGTESGTDAECLVRHGLAGRVGWYAADAPAPGRGEAVVLRTSRGVELGEVLKVEPSKARAGEDSIGVFRVLRAAEPADLELAQDVERLRDARFDLCRRVVEEAGWALELVDVEPLLDLSTVLHVLPLEEFDPALVRARFRMSGDFDVHVETLGDEPATAPAPEPEPEAAGGCGTGCGSCGVAALRGGKRSGA